MVSSIIQFVVIHVQVTDVLIAPSYELLMKYESLII